jgi:hypothetical protein
MAYFAAALSLASLKCEAITTASVSFRQQPLSLMAG